MSSAVAIIGIALGIIGIGVRLIVAFKPPVSNLAKELLGWSGYACITAGIIMLLALGVIRLSHGAPDRYVQVYPAAIDKLSAKQAQSTAHHWLRLKPFQIGDLSRQLGAIGKYQLSVLWDFRDSGAYGLAADLDDACRVAQWSVCIPPQKLSESVWAIGITVHWQEGYQPIAQAISDSLTDVIGMPVGVAPTVEPNLKTPVEVIVGIKP
jgi:hypothetical protein